MSEGHYISPCNASIMNHVFKDLRNRWKEMICPMMTEGHQRDNDDDCEASIGGKQMNQRKMLTMKHLACYHVDMSNHDYNYPTKEEIADLDTAMDEYMDEYMKNGYMDNENQGKKTYRLPSHEELAQMDPISAHLYNLLEDGWIDEDLNNENQF